MHRRRSIAPEFKKERIELRVAPSAKELIRRAMAVSGLTAGDLVYEGARRVLDEHERMLLTGADRDAFLDAVRNPPEPADKLVSALKRATCSDERSLSIVIEPFGKHHHRAAFSYGRPDLDDWFRRVRMRSATSRESSWPSMMNWA